MCSYIKEFKWLMSLMLLAHISVAQMPHDAIYMPSKTVCSVVGFSNSTWKNYWEGSFIRDNPNIGTFQNSSITAMAAVGITNKLNLIISLPYIKTSTTQGFLKGQQGLQDLNVLAKYQLYKNSKGLSLNLTSGFSLPASNYVPDFLPLSIGLKSKTFSNRLILNYQTANNIYFNTSLAYILRSKVKLDRDSFFYKDKVYNSYKMPIPNAIEMAFRVGYLNNKFQAEMFFEQFSCTNGDDIRRNDMPSSANMMKSSSTGVYLKYQPKNFGFNARASSVISGQNVGKTTQLMVGLLFQFKY